MTPERIDELLALAALGELSPTDQIELDAAVAGDPSLEADLDEMLSTAAALQASHREAPPADMRTDVLAAIAATPQETGPQPAVPPVVGEPVAAGASAPAPVPIEAARRRRRLLPALLAAAAALVFVVGAFIVSNEASAPDEFAAVLDAADAEVHELHGDLPGTLTVTYSPSHNAMVVQGDGLPELSDDETYQLWFDVEGHMVPAGLFRPDDDGHVEERIVVADGTGESINVTEEPAGGSESPTLPVLATTV